MMVDHLCHNNKGERVFPLICCLLLFITIQAFAQPQRIVDEQRAMIRFKHKGDFRIFDLVANPQGTGYTITGNLRLQDSSLAGYIGHLDQNLNWQSFQVDTTYGQAFRFEKLAWLNDEMLIAAGRTPAGELTVTRFNSKLSLEKIQNYKKSDGIYGLFDNYHLVRDLEVDTKQNIWIIGMNVYSTRPTYSLFFYRLNSSLDSLAARYHDEGEFQFAHSLIP
jgi:hypothetical protein